MTRGKNSVPYRWHDYRPLKRCIKGTKFIPIKVPLREQICGNTTKEQRFMPEDLLEVLADKKLTLGLIVDLTNTTRYYNPQIFIDQGIEYEKIFTEGQCVPSNEVFMRFSKVVKKFEDSNINNDAVIAVHCTHGVNRSGYLICRYMIECLSFSPDDAIKAFKEGRGHGIERKPYIDSLKSLKNTNNVTTSVEFSYNNSRTQKPPFFNKEAPYRSRTQSAFIAEPSNRYGMQSDFFDVDPSIRYEMQSASGRYEKQDWSKKQYYERTQNGDYGIKYARSILPYVDFDRPYHHSNDLRGPPDCKDFRGRPDAFQDSFQSSSQRGDDHYYSQNNQYRNYRTGYERGYQQIHHYPNEHDDLTDFFRFHSYSGQQQNQYDPYSMKRTDNRKEMQNRYNRESQNSYNQDQQNRYIQENRYNPYSWRRNDGKRTYNQMKTQTY